MAGFKAGNKLNPHSVRSERKEIEELRRRLHELENEKLMTPFIDKMSENIMVILANSPFEWWPNIAKTGFEHARDKYPVPAEIYKRNLPKPNPEAAGS